MYKIRLGNAFGETGLYRLVGGQNHNCNEIPSV
jgi:hypothetical protein